MTLVKTFIQGQLATNCYLILENEKYYLIDCGLEPKKIMAYLDENNIRLEAILITHTHFDHVYGINELHEYDKDIDIYIPDAEVELLTNPESLQMLKDEFGIDWKLQTPIKYLSTFAENFFEIAYINGHSKLSAVFINHEAKKAFSGDTLFKDNIGRWDFAYGNYDNLITGIKNYLFVLDDDYTVYPGHGFRTNIGYEKKNNLHLK